MGDMMPESNVKKPKPLEKNLEDISQELPDEITSWLGRLVLLYGVPLNYLIPEEAMLPKESIRFFFIDPIWIQCLVQGACSVGNTGVGDTIVDRAMNNVVQPTGTSGNHGGGLAAQAAAGVRDQLRHQFEGIGLAGDKKGLTAADQSLNWPLIGFLLRSRVVDGWRGLEVMAYQKKKGSETGLNPEQLRKLKEEGLSPLKALRIEQLSADVMMGIFNGRIAQLVIRQPQEGLHFGLEPGPDPVHPSYKKTLRVLGFKNQKQAGNIIEDQPILLSDNNLMRDQENKGVIRIADLAAVMKQKLKDDLIDDKFTSAEFAVEMIEAPGEFTFSLTPPDGQS